MHMNAAVFCGSLEVRCGISFMIFIAFRGSFYDLYGIVYTRASSSALGFRDRESCGAPFDVVLGSIIQ